MPSSQGIPMGEEPEKLRAILYGWDGDPLAEVAASGRQQLAEEIGSEIHQAMVGDSTLSEIRVQILDEDGKPRKEWDR